MKKSQVLLKVVLFLLAALSFLSSCNKGQNEFSDYDKAAIIEHGIHHIFQSSRFVSDFYLNPVQIVKSSNVPGSVRIVVNGRSCALIDELSKELYQEDPGHPLPFVKVVKLDRIGTNLVGLDVEFPSIETTFYMKIKHSPGDIPEIVALSSSKAMK